MGKNNFFLIKYIVLILILILIIIVILYVLSFINNLWKIKIYNNTYQELKDIEIIFNSWYNKKILKFNELLPWDYITINNKENYIEWEWNIEIKFFKNNIRYERKIVLYYIKLEYVKTFIEEKNWELFVSSYSFWNKIN